METGKVSFLPRKLPGIYTYIKVYVMKAMDFNARLFRQFQTFQKFAVVTVFYLREDPLY